MAACTLNNGHTVGGGENVHILSLFVCLLGNQWEDVNSMNIGKLSILLFFKEKSVHKH